MPPPTGESGSAMNDTVKSLQDASAEMQSDESKNPRPLIQKVPFARRDAETFRKYYEPRVFTIGPIHHDENKFKLSEKMKQKLAALFTDENGLEKEVLWNKIKGHIMEFKNCHNEEDIDKKYWDDDEKLVSILFVDGCALLQYIDYVTVHNKTKLKEVKIMSDQVVSLDQDLFLLENQLPYQVLETLINCFPCEENRNQMKDSICRFIDRLVMFTRGDIEERTDPSHLNHVTHLLELFRKQLLRPHGVKRPHGVEQRKKVRKPKYEPAADEVWFNLNHVSELRATGTLLTSEKKGYLQDISFTPGWIRGTLKLPSLIVDDSTASKFLNLMAYEMCPDFRNNFEVSSYVSFLDTLISEPNDVKELRDAKVFFNLLGNDAEVAKMFGEIGTYLVPSRSTYESVRRDILRHHYDSSWRIWIGRGLYTYFDGPWTIIAFIGAMFALLFTAVQTACSILSAMERFKGLRLNF